MSTIVLNLKNGAVTEYSGFDFHAITPTHAGSSLGLYELGGNTDARAPIVATIKTGKSLWGSSLKKFVDLVFLAIKSAGTGRVLIDGENTPYGFSFPIDPRGESRCKTARGIKENYLAFGFTNPAGQDFQIDRMEANVTPSKTRRTQ